MKKIILGMTVLAVAAAGLQTAKASDQWAVAGKIFTGLVVASAINHAIADEQRCATVVYSEPAACRSYSYGYYPPAPRVVYPPPVYCAPAPVVVYRAPVYFPPAPVVGFRFNHDGEHRHFRHDRW